MPARAVVRILPTASETRIVATDASGDEILKARLPPAPRVHRRAMKTLLEALALFCNARLYVVLSADAEAVSFDTGLLDDLGLGVDTLHYELEVHVHRGRRGQRLRGLGDFRDVRRLEGGPP